MDANKVIETMNKTWADLLDQYYDHISKTIVNEISNKHNMNESEMIEFVNALKPKIMNIDNVKIVSKTVSKTTTLEQSSDIPSDLKSLSRKDLQGLAKKHGLAAKRKTVELIDDLSKIAAAAVVKSKGKEIEIVDTALPECSKNNEDQAECSKKTKTDWAATTPPSSPKKPPVTPDAPKKGIIALDMPDLPKNITAFTFDEEEYESDDE